MNILKGIQIIDLALYLKKQKSLVITDLHLGHENSLEFQGLLLPRFQLKDMIDNLEQVFSKVKVRTVIINGDLKHEFGRILRQEWKDISRFFDYLSRKCNKIVVIKGNHDVLLGTLADKRAIRLKKEFRQGDILIAHGDSEPKLNKTVKTIIIGHEHPAISLRENRRIEKFKCFLKGKYKNRNLIVQPSFNPLIEGSDVSREEILSPLIKNISGFEAFVVSRKEILYFGKINKFRDH